MKYIHLQNYQSLIDNSLLEMENAQIMKRIWDHDFTVWKNNPEEISNRLAWLEIACEMTSEIKEINNFVNELLIEGYKKVLLMGMGGSSLAPEVYRKTFGVKEGYLDLSILDSTDPEMVQSYARSISPQDTLFIVSTKSGGTIETLSFFKYFYTLLVDKLGEEEAGKRFILITDPGSSLIDLAQTYHFRKIFLNNPNLGGRYSALSHFGLVPAAMIGVDISLILERAQVMMQRCQPNISYKENPAVFLGALLAEMAKNWRDKVTYLLTPDIQSFGDWVEQLIAESTGKEKKGILPVVKESLGDPMFYFKDRLFIVMSLPLAESSWMGRINNLILSGQPVIHLELQDYYDIGGQFFLWELATAIAGYRLEVNPFNQPNVEISKKITRQIIKKYSEGTPIDEPEPLVKRDEMIVYGDIEAYDPYEALRVFLSPCHPGDYIAIQAYVNPNRETECLLLRLCTVLRDSFQVATTVGYGPRFLHSTGQLHKGDAGNGYFIQFTSEPQIDIPIPDEIGSWKSQVSFGALIKFQALGDYYALQNGKRKIIRYHFENKVSVGLDRLIRSLQ